MRPRGGFYWTTGMTGAAIDLVGQENLMVLMCTNPDGVHRLMAFLRDDTIAFIEWLEREGLFSLNNENDYIGSGSTGYTTELPQTDWRPDGPVRTRDLWVLCESQETSEVGPAMFDEFVFQYQRPIIERFGRVYYGCCEGLHHKWAIIRRLLNLRRVSISPWSSRPYRDSWSALHRRETVSPNWQQGQGRTDTKNWRYARPGSSDLQWPPRCGL